MMYEVELFGPYADAVGARTLRLELESDRSHSAAEVLEAAGAGHPELRPLLARTRLAVNDRFSAPDQAVSPSDRLALVGMVGGG